jgi:DNA-binding phage protein
MSPTQPMSQHLNWRGITVLGLVVGALMLGLYIGTREVADRAAHEAVQTTRQQLQRGFYESDVASTKTLQRGCKLNTQRWRYVIAFLESAAHARAHARGALNAETAREYNAYRNGLVRNLPPGTSPRLDGVLTCLRAYPLPTAPK